MTLIIVSKWHGDISSWGYFLPVMVITDRVMRI